MEVGPVGYAHLNVNVVDSLLQHHTLDGDYIAVEPEGSTDYACQVDNDVGIAHSGIL